MPVPAGSPAGAEGIGADGLRRAVDERVMAALIADYLEQNKNIIRPVAGPLLAMQFHFSTSGVSNFECEALVGT
jgi:hypothetical protein